MEQKLNTEVSGHFPLFVDIRGKKILVIGAGKIAERRIKTLLTFGVHMKVIAPEASPAVKELAEAGVLIWEQRAYCSGEIDSFFMVLAVTDNLPVNEEIYMECKEKGILVNVASDRTKCDFFFPGIIKEDPLVIGVTASGENHKKAREMVVKIKEMLNQETS